MKRIYLDHAATTPVDKRVQKAMRDFEGEFFGNPSSIHEEGQKARAQIDFARSTLADFFRVKSQEIIFTSGATESNNHAISGVVSYCLKELAIKPHVITTGLEHHSVYNLIKELQNKDIIEASFAKPNKDGTFSAENIIKEVRDNTVLISAIYVSNEIGSVLPLREIGSWLAEYNRKNSKKILFHTDAVQAVKFYNCNPEKLGVDLLTFSAHKIGGPKGVGGLLFTKTGKKIHNLMYGGAQEYDKRPGTQNTTGIIGMAKAYELLGSLEQRQKIGKKIMKLKKLLADGLTDKKIEFNTPAGEGDSAPDILSFLIKGVDQDMIIAKMDLMGISASTGSACVSGSSEPSHVIKALEKTSKSDQAVVRLSLGINTTESEIKTAIKIINNILKSA